MRTSPSRTTSRFQHTGPALLTIESHGVDDVSAADLQHQPSAPELVLSRRVGRNFFRFWA